ncbi:AAA family ATPase [Streptomyces scabiei]|uniref:AAA family ATPase n=1 Tax=Streptomyces scabiei TaxID=1930 RepID=UPI00299012A3|nr:AAA family ATPase [Streptomyces scabiei]MDW8804274.1 AAA family ATPase [Streptomyces scabiei]
MPPNRRRPGRKPTVLDQNALYAAFMEAILDDKDVVALGWKDETGLHFEQNTGAQMKSAEGPRVIAKTVDLYFTPCPQASEFDTERNPNGRMRGQGMALPGRCCWVDCDEGLTPEMLGLAKKIGAFVVESGSVTADDRPRLHLYFPLDAPTDPRVIRWLNIQLRDKFNGDHKHDPASILRIPNTYNHKTSPPRPVTIAHATTTRNAPDALAKALGVVIPPDEELGNLDSAEAASRKDVNAYLEEFSEVDPEKAAPIKGYVRNFRTALLDTGSRHTAMMQVLPWALREAGEGRVNAQTALDELRGRFSKALNNTPGRSADNEFDSMVAWALGQVRFELKQEAEETEAKVSAMASRLLGMDELFGMPDPLYLIDGWLTRGTFARIVGQPGSYKTFVAIHMAMCVATGRPFYGGVDVEEGKVLYLIAEGAEGFKKRIQAWVQRFDFDESKKGNLRFLPDPIQVMEDEWKQFIRVCVDEKPILIVLDTQARITLGIEESSNSEMGNVVQRIEDLRKATGACVLLVHHAGHGQERGRGASAMLAAVNTELLLTKNQSTGNTKLENQKEKDEKDGSFLELIPEIVTLGKDAKDRDITSVVLHAGASQTEKHHIPKANKLRDEILAFIEANPGCKSTDVRDGVSGNTNEIKDERAKLASDGLIENRGTGSRPLWHRTNTKETLF